MARFQYTRFETIYDNREQAIELLSGLSRLYAETVAVKYYDSLGNICIILGLYKSTAPGDFEISYETKESSGSLPRVFTVKRVDNQSNAECINIALFGETPINRDIVIITESNNILDYAIGNSKEEYFLDIFIENGVIKGDVSNE